MSVVVLDCEQGSDEWRAARAGIPTASEFSSILAKGEGKMRRSYMLRLAGERLTGSPAETYSNAHMERGREMEAEARDYYSLVSGPVTRVGFVRDDAKGAGCSPDSFIGARGALEIKTALPAILIDKIDRGGFPPEHKAQCQGVLWVAEREWIDLLVYWPSMPPYTVRARRDEDYIATLAGEVARFNDDLAALVEKVRRYGDPAGLHGALAASVEDARRTGDILMAG